MTDIGLPESLTSLSIDGMKLDTDCWNWQAIPDTLHSIHLADIHITSGSHLTWLQQLSSIQNLSMKISVTRSEIVDLYRSLDCLICAPNLRSVDLSIEFSQNSLNVLRALSKLTSLSVLTLRKGRHSLDPQLGCCPGDWLLTLTSISSLYLWDLPAVCIAAVSLTWLSALSIFAQSHQVLTASTLASLAQLTRLTSLRLKGPALGNVQLTFLHCLADLAVCELDASWYDLRTRKHHFKELRHSYQALFGLSALTLCPCQQVTH